MEAVILFGALGGVARGLVGYMKHFQAYKNVEFSWSYFGMSVGISAAVGLAVVWALVGANITLIEGMAINPALAFIIGYAGGDAIENIFKILLKKPVIGSFGSLISKK